MLRYDLDNKLRRNLLRLVRGDNILKLLLGNLHCNVRFLKVGVGEQFIERTFQLTDVGLDVGCNVIKDLVA